MLRMLFLSKSNVKFSSVPLLYSDTTVSLNYGSFIPDNLFGDRYNSEIIIVVVLK